MPEGSITPVRRNRSNTSIDEEKCDGCKWCLEACDYGAITYDKDAKTVKICELCDGKPKCKKMCPEEADIVKEWIAASGNLVQMAKGGGETDFLLESKEIMERIDEKYKELFER